MKCKGCKNCKILHYPDDNSRNYLHYCNSRKFYTDVDDSIGDSYKYCQGKYFENKE